MQLGVHAANTGKPHNLLHPNLGERHGNGALVNRRRRGVLLVYQRKEKINVKVIDRQGKSKNRTSGVILGSAWCL